MSDCDIIGGFPITQPNCLGCGEPLKPDNAWMTDGCPCNSKLGCNSMNETRWRLLMELQQRQARELESSGFNAVCNRIARDMPAGWQLEISLGASEGSVELTDPEGEDIEFASSRECMLDEVNDALEEAIEIESGAEPAE